MVQNPIVRVLQKLIFSPLLINQFKFSLQSLSKRSSTSETKSDEKVSTAIETKPKPIHVLVPNLHPRFGTVIVIGQPRGGTSVTSGLCHLIGAQMGSDIDPSNMEDQIFRKISHSSDRQTLIRSAINSLAELGPLKGFKDPLVTDYLQEILPLIDLPIFVFVIRDVVAIAERETFEGQNFVKALQEADERRRRIVEFILKAVSDGIPSCAISYERLLAEPETAFIQLSHFLIGHTDPIHLSLIPRLVLPNSRMPEEINFVDIASSLHRANFG